MTENNHPAAEPLQKGAQAAQMVRGAVKTMTKVRLNIVLYMEKVGVKQKKKGF